MLTITPAPVQGEAWAEGEESEGVWEGRGEERLRTVPDPYRLPVPSLPLRKHSLKKCRGGAPVSSRTEKPEELVLPQKCIAVAGNEGGAGMSGPSIAGASSAAEAAPRA